MPHAPTAPSLQPAALSFSSGSDAQLKHSLAHDFDCAVTACTAARLAALRESTRGLAVAMRVAGLSPEQALVEIKDAIHGHGGWRPSLEVADGAEFAETCVYSRMFRWWLRAYFAD